MRNTTEIWNGHAAVFEALVAAGRAITRFDLGHGTRPLNLAIDRQQPAVVAVLLQLGAVRDDHNPSSKTAGSYRLFLLSRATREPAGLRMAELLLQHGVAVAGSGALHSAAGGGALDTMRLLMQHGADVDERLPEDTLPYLDRSLHASWTPRHFGASSGQAEAMKLLESNGPQAGVVEGNGKTAWQLLQEKQASDATKT